MEGMNRIERACNLIYLCQNSEECNTLEKSIKCFCNKKLSLYSPYEKRVIKKKIKDWKYRGWIRTTFQKPPVGTMKHLISYPVILFDEDIGVNTGEYYFNGKFKTWINGIEFFKVTHWMHLPDAPEKNQNGV